MFIRKKANKNGSYSILLLTGERIPGKKHVVSRMIKNFGTTSSKKEVDELIRQAELYKAQLKNCVSKKIKSLKLNGDIDIASCCTYQPGFADIYGHLFQKTFNSLTLKPSLLNQLNDLVALRVAHPCSKRATTMQAENYGFDLTLNSVYRFMDKLTLPIINMLRQAIYQQTVKLLSEQKRKVNILFYDLTTIYFETNTQDELRNFGFSKDGKYHHVQIMLAVIVTEDGLPIDYEEFRGNYYEGHTLIPVIDKIQRQYNVEKAVLVADAALMNKINLQELTDRGIKYVIAARIKNAKKDLKNTMFDLETYTHVSSSHNSDGIIEDNILAKKIQLKTGDWLVAYYSSKRARKDELDRQDDLEKIKNYLSSTGKNKLTTRLKKPYVVIRKDCAIEIDLEKLKLEQTYDGFFGFQTNMEDINPKELLKTYRGLWQVEQTFRIAKSNLEIRPIFHYTPQRIKAHFAICYIALALIRYAQFIINKSGLAISIDQLHTLIEKMCVIKIKNSDNNTFEITRDCPAELRIIYQIFNIPWRKRFTSL
jgi:transposase